MIIDQIRTKFLPFLATFLIFCGTTSGWAKFDLELISDDKKSGVQSLKIEYSKTATPETSLVQVPTIDGGFVTQEVPVSRDSEQEGILIKLSESNSCELENWNTIASPELKKRISLKKVNILAEDFIHLVFDHTDLPIKAYEFSVQIPSDCKINLNFQERGFETGKVVSSLSNKLSTNKGTIPSVPQPIGEWRIPVDTPKSLLRIPRSLFGITEAEFANLTVSHWQFDLPVIRSTNEMIVFVPDYESRYTTGTQLMVRSGISTNSPELITTEAFATLSSASVEISQNRSRLYEEDNVYIRSANEVPGERFFFAQVANITGFQGLSTNYSTTLPFTDILTDLDVEAFFAFNSFSSNVSYNPDHYAFMRLEGIDLTPISWEGNIQHSASQMVTMPAADNGGSLDLYYEAWQDSVLTDNFALDSQMLNRVNLSWEGLPRVDAAGRGTLDIFGNANAVLATMGGLPLSADSSDLIVLDIDSPTTPIQVVNFNTFTTTDSTKAVEFEVPIFGREYFVQAYDSIPVADQIFETKSIPDFVDNGTTLNRIYIRGEEFAAALDPLVTHRGVGTFEMEPRAAYDTFAYGHAEPEAIREAIASLYGLAPQKRMPLPATIIGFSSPDPKNNTGLVTESVIPTYLEFGVGFTFGNIEHTVDYNFGLLEGNDEFPEAIMGRIMVREPGALQNAVARIIAYEISPSNHLDSNKLGLFVADDEEQFHLATDDFEAVFENTGRLADRINVNFNSPDDATQRTNLINAFESAAGRSLTVYTGHGNTTNWSSQLLRESDISVMDTNNRWPIIVTFTCLNGYFGTPGSGPSLSETWLALEPQYGAVANIAPVGVDTFEQQAEMTESFLKPLNQAVNLIPVSIGDMLFLGYVDHATRLPAASTTRREFILFGDPETKLFLSETASIEDPIWQNFE